MFYRRALLYNFATFFGKHLRFSPLCCNFIIHAASQFFFAVNIAKFFRLTVLQNILQWLSLDIYSICFSEGSVIPKAARDSEIFG